MGGQAGMAGIMQQHMGMRSDLDFLVGDKIRTTGTCACVCKCKIAMVGTQSHEECICKGLCADHYSSKGMNHSCRSLT